MTTVGYGEASLAHNMKNITHSAQLLVGGGEAMKNLRWSVRGVCIDQGSERRICGAPNILKIADVTAMLAAAALGELKLMASEPDSFFFPLMLYVAGPLHDIWNVFFCETREGNTEVASFLRVLDIYPRAFGQLAS